MKRYILHTSLFILSFFILSSCKSDEETVPDQTPAETITLNVDVVLPPDIQSQWQHSIDMALANIAKAQQKMSRKVVLNLRYHDEDSENLVMD